MPKKLQFKHKKWFGQKNKARDTLVPGLAPIASNDTLLSYFASSSMILLLLATNLVISSAPSGM